MITKANISSLFYFGNRPQKLREGTKGSSGLSPQPFLRAISSIIAQLIDVLSTPKSKLSRLTSLLRLSNWHWWLSSSLTFSSFTYELIICVSLDITLMQWRCNVERPTMGSILCILTPSLAVISGCKFHPNTKVYTSGMISSCDTHTHTQNPPSCLNTQSHRITRS